MLFDIRCAKVKGSHLDIDWFYIQIYLHSKLQRKPDTVAYSKGICQRWPVHCWTTLLDLHSFDSWRCWRVYPCFEWGRSCCWDPGFWLVASLHSSHHHKQEPVEQLFCDMWYWLQKSHRMGKFGDFTFKFCCMAWMETFARCVLDTLCKVHSRAPLAQSLSRTKEKYSDVRIHHST